MLTVNYITLNERLQPFISNKSMISDVWASLTLKGNNFNDFARNIEDLIRYLKSVSKDNYLKITIDNELVANDEVKDHIILFNTWELNINKTGLLQTTTTGIHENFFVLQKAFIEWLDASDPFNKDNPFNKYPTKNIFIFDLTTPVYSSTLKILPLNLNQELKVKKEYNFPSPEKINESVNILSNKDIVINPTSFLVIDGNVDGIIGESLRKKATVILAASLVNNFYGVDKITLDGFRNITLKLSEPTEEFSSTSLTHLSEAVEWVYQERVSTRKKLLAERLSIDIDNQISFVKGLEKHLPSALSQAQSRYNFIILDRKDLYLKELKDLLKDIKGQSDLYSVKIRTLLSNLLRDSLAAIFLIGFTIFTKFSDSLQLDKVKLLDYVFDGLALFYIVSISYQVFVDIFDIRVSKNELLYWKNAVRELLPETEFNSHISKSLKGRRRSLYIIYPLIIVSYLLVAFGCFKFPDYFRKIELNNSQTTKSRPLPKVAKKDSLMIHAPNR